MVEFDKKKEGETAEGKTEREKKLAQLEKKDRKCKSQIIQRMGDSHLEYAKDKGNSYELWSSLCNVFERKGIASQLLIRKSLLTMKFDSTNDTLANHFLKFDKSIRDLRSTGATLEETDIVCHLLLTMPNEYEVVVTALETLSKQDLTLNFVKNRLLEEEKNVSNKVNIASKQFENLCKNEEESKSLCFTATTNYESESSISYFLDSGATKHLVCTNVLLSNVRKLKKPIRISVAKSRTHIEANKVGDIDIMLTSFDERRFSFGTVTSEKWLNNKEIEEKNDEEVEENQETEERIFENIDLKEMCVKNGEDEVEDIESRSEYEVESRLEDEVVTFRRSKREKQKPSYLNDYAVPALSAESFVNNVTTSYEEIKTRQDKQEWFQAVQEEIESLKENDTWELTKLPPGRKFLDSKWVCKIKENKNGNVERYKARLVIKGCAQRKGWDYEETYAPVARLTTLRTLISVIKEKDLYAYFGSEYDRKSTSGFLMKVFGNAVHWATKRQISVALSSTESKYIALAMTVTYLLWLKKVFEDNQSCIHLLHKWEHRRLKHVDVKYNFVRDLTGKGIVDVKYICTSEQLVDILTKSLSSEQFLKLRLRLGLMKVEGINTVLEENC
ncbi:hypothetical protein ILUMI_10949 [Ignelater luminosus]|uniref:Reverse transcriptase Ty1/copia-type domain-containing protein n=1 Tax=Ignelater luminosus TaxID=2038154 RepID=A0A8K0D152_IGNLU|nr:hypothetical protein ILUMI_10949 [Ignelater luminosus]